MSGLSLGSGSFVSVAPIWTNLSVTASGTHTSDAWRIRDFAIQGKFSLGIKVAGTGRISVGYQISLDGTTYITPSSASSICSNFTATSGTGGFDIITFSPPVAPYMKIQLTEHAAGTPTVNSWLSIA